MKSDKIGIVLVLILFIGVCGLLYPALSQYWNTKTQTRAVENYQDILNTLDEKDYTAFFKEAKKYNKNLAACEEPLIHHRQVKGYNDILNVSGNGIMGYLSIQKLGVELPLYHSIAEEILNTSCGHLEGSSFPIDGKSVHSVLSAHRGLPHAKLFTELDKMELGDTFQITVLDRKFTYQVDQIKIVRPDESNDIQIIEGENHCTLLTCTPYGINSHRLLVRGTLIENAVPTFYVMSGAYRIDPLVATPVVAIPILFVLLLILMIKYKDTGSKPLISKEDDEWLEFITEDETDKLSP